MTDVRRTIFAAALTLSSALAGAHGVQPLPVRFEFPGRDAVSVAITFEIAGVREDAHGEWTYYVNGNRSIYHINTQTAQDVHSIRFLFKPK